MESSERFMAEARKYLEYAHEYEVAGQIELADAAGAIAANKIAAALRCEQKCPTDIRWAA